jgi:hypothetical protein
MANRRKQSPVRDKMLVERKTPADNRRPVRDEICRKYRVPDGTLTLPENQFPTNILSLPGHCDVDMTLICRRCTRKRGNIFTHVHIAKVQFGRHEA